MSTRSAIIHKTATGYEGIYCHFDGYLEGVGKTLQEHYQDPSKVAALIALGDISVLAERVDPVGPHSFENKEKGTTVAYGRDRGETGTEPKTGASITEVSEMIENNGYVYVFDGGWTCNGAALPRDEPTQTPADALLDAINTCLPDLDHYVSTHGAGPDVRYHALLAAIEKFCAPA